jgi:hypothetical protein
MDESTSFAQTVDVLTAFFLGAFCMWLFIAVAYGAKTK